MSDSCMPYVSEMMRIHQQQQQQQQQQQACVTKNPCDEIKPAGRLSSLGPDPGASTVGAAIDRVTPADRSGCRANA